MTLAGVSDWNYEIYPESSALKQQQMYDDARCLQLVRNVIRLRAH